MFALVKRVGEKDENLAAFFYSILLSTNTIIMISFPLKLLTPKGTFTLYPYNILIKGILASVFFILYFICKYYFLKKGNYIIIIANYSKRYKGKERQMALIGVFYSIFTFVSFISLAMWLSRM
jgi:hypothetical protein